jgi:hypothetical protein
MGYHGAIVTSTSLMSGVLQCHVWQSKPHEFNAQALRRREEARSGKVAMIPGDD